MKLNNEEVRRVAIKLYSETTALPLEFSEKYCKSRGLLSFLYDVAAQLFLNRQCDLNKDNEFLHSAIRQLEETGII